MAKVHQVTEILNPPVLNQDNTAVIVLVARYQVVLKQMNLSVVTESKCQWERYTVALISGIDAM